ncbi:MAG: hypothetical protein J1E41_00745 [Ruminococcus sp.]|nr:hypothetical protein [Ruminococcus sp.]
MNYTEWAQEYYRDAENVMKTIKKYENILKNSKEPNEENLNSIIASYRYIYYDILNTAKMLDERAKENKNAA